MPRITASKIVLLFTFSFFVTVFYHSLIQDSRPNENDFHSLPVNIENRAFRRLPDAAPDSFQNRVQFLRVDDEAYAFSAFTDDRDGNMGYKYVRIPILITQNERFSCEINGKASTDVTLYEFSENHGKKWQLFILNCKLPSGIAFNDVNSVTVCRNSSGNTVKVPIRYRIQDEKSKTTKEYGYKMSICVPALFGNRYNAKRLIEFIELNSLQGIEKIYIYYNPKEINDKTVIKTLQHYSNINKVNLIEFALPFFNDDVWYHGQLAAITDCLLQNTGITQYTFFNDIDEFFVPVLRNQTLLHILDGLFNNEAIGSQRIALKYISTKVNQAPYTLNNVVSTKWLETRFTKCVVRPEMVFEQGIHHTSRVINDNYQTAIHNGSLLRVYHYKEPKYCCEDEGILRKRYGERLKEKFNSVIALLEV